MPYLNASIFTEKKYICHDDRYKLVYHTLQLVACHYDLARVSIIAKRANFTDCYTNAYQIRFCICGSDVTIIKGSTSTIQSITTDFLTL